MNFADLLTARLARDAKKVMGLVALAQRVADLVDNVKKLVTDIAELGDRLKTLESKNGEEKET